MLKRILSILLGLILGFTVLVVCCLSVAVIYYAPKLPTLEAVTNYQPKLPLMIYSADAKLIGTYGEEKRAFTPIEEFPEVLKNAVLAAEDKRFYEHWGVDILGVARAMITNIHSGKIKSGASTITQQVAKNFFLNNDKDYIRKFNEALLAYRIEKALSKDQILELYFNQMYLGQRSYGFAAAAKIYYNKDVKDLTIAESAMLAGLPKAPSLYNPVVNFKRAKERQVYILNNMLELNMISKEQYDQAATEELHFEKAKDNIDENGLYVAEMVRQILFERYGEAAYTRGFKVYTTISSADQEIATQSLRKALRTFTNNHPKYTGAEYYIDISKLKDQELEETLDRHLSLLSIVDNMYPAIVTKANKDFIEVAIQNVDERLSFSKNELKLVKSAILNEKLGNKQIQPGAVIRVAKNNKDKWYLTQEPELQGAIVSIDAQTGAILALVGGYNFYQKEFNRATQAWRQPGSTFKPFIYSAAIEKGMTMATMVNDAPLSIPGLGPRGSTWNPKNASGKFSGYMPLRDGLKRSVNIVSIRTLMATGLDYTHDYIQRFGFSNKQPKSLSIALGSGSSTPLQMSEAYAVFANGGYKTSAYIIDKIYDDAGNLVAQTKPIVAGRNAKQVIDPRNSFIMYKMLQDVVTSGTGHRARALGRNDIAGKTGTTNQQKDAWFVGFTPKVVTTVFVGFDKPRTMGRAGYGGSIALPIWIDYMREALKEQPQEPMKQPDGITKIGNNYFYKEWQHTNPNLALDNRNKDELYDFDDFDELLTGRGNTIPPINNPSNNQDNVIKPLDRPSSNKNTNSTELDSLF